MTSRVTEIPAASSEEVHAYYAHRLAVRPIATTSANP
jgi:hypothetical protein